MAHRNFRTRLHAADQDAYLRVAALPMHPAFERAVAGLSSAADHSKISIAVAGGLAVFGGRDGGRSAVEGLAAIAVTSAVVNLGLKPLRRRARPDRAVLEVPSARHVRLPESSSFPSGHTASAFAFASGVSIRTPALAAPLAGLAAAVGYSRVHTGVHYPLDVIVGAGVGTVLGQMVGRAVDGRLPG